MRMEKGRYGLPTVIAMIVGIVIGSGIFFKSDNILLATGGNVPLGVAVFLLGGIGIVFGGLCLGELAARTDRPGGVIAYAEDLAGPPAAAVFGWFQVFVYLPAIITVVSSAVGVYACQLFGWGRSLEENGLFLLQMGIGMAFVLLCYTVNASPPGWAAGSRMPPPSASWCRFWLWGCAASCLGGRNPFSGWAGRPQRGRAGSPRSRPLPFPSTDGRFPPPSRARSDAPNGTFPWHW